MKMSGPENRRSWTQLRRFEFLEWKMLWEDRVIRDDLEKTFDISTPQASVDLRNYREVAPNNMEQTARGYRPAPGFKPKFLKDSADRLLLQLRAYLLNILPRHDIWFKDLPGVDAAPDITRSVSSKTLRPLLRSIRNRTAIEIEYSSLSNSRRRWIAPHALAFDGQRWHARAWYPEKGDFRDFVLSRISKTFESKQVDYDPNDDTEWTTKVTLRLVPHRGLTPEQSRAIQLDYGMRNGWRDIEMRASLAFYFVRRLNLDLVQSDVLTPERLQIELENFGEVNEKIELARANSSKRVSANTTGPARS